LPIEAGQTLLHYRLVEKIGEGGMGVVWKAVDTTLDREAAIKVLPDIFAGEHERMARFQREAKVLASLNHPNIAAVYGFHEADGVRFLAMEFVDGENLAQRLERGALPLEEGLEIARSMARALEAAHEQGVVHRDLKPANVVVTGDGEVKILDFGLAKALDTSAESGTVSPTMSPTLTSAGTAAGVILGTAAYMSPEQAKGKTADRRADIWAFGVTVHEMLSGSQLFRGESVSETLAAVLLTEPSMEALPRETPARLRRLLERCLTKDPRQRLRDIGEARIALGDLAAGETEDELHAAVVQPVIRKGIGILPAAAGLVLAGALAAAAVWWLKPAPPEALTKFELPIERLDNGPSYALSADGRSIAYAEANQLWIRRLDKLEPREIPGTTGATIPFWSPDGAWVGYAADSRLWKVAVSGGESVLISELPNRIVRGAGASWGDDGNIVFSYGGGPLYEVPARGGDVHLLLEANNEAGEDHFHEPSHLPGGRGILYTVHRGANKGIDTLSVLADGASRPVLQLEAQSLWKPVYSPTGHILFARFPTNAGVWALPFSLDTLEATGEPFLIVPDGDSPSVSSNGTLISRIGGGSTMEQLVWLNREGEIEGTIGQPQPDILFASLSPDGKRVAVTAHEGDNWDVWIHDVDRATKTRLTFDDDADWNPIWSPDGRSIAHSRGGNVFVRQADGTGPEQDLGKGEAISFSGDGAQVVFAADDDNGHGDIWHRTIAADGEAELFLASEADEWAPRLSPDGRYIAYESDESGQDEIYLMRFPNGEGKWQVSVDGGKWPLWTRAGQELIYRDGNVLMSVAVRTEPSVELGTPQQLFSGDEARVTLAPRRFDVTADGQRIVAVQSVDRQAEDRNGLMVALNWFAEFRESR
jgi:serine/threonine-protein kinase